MPYFFLILSLLIEFASQAVKKLFGALSELILNAKLDWVVKANSSENLPG